jgi:UDP-N-acetylglucosamine 2-epimerase (non-hydrolysing)
MIAVVYGTTGEVIKLAPLLRRLAERPGSALTVCTGQQIEQIPAMLRDFELPTPDIWLRSETAKDLERLRNVPGWLLDVMRRFVRRKRGLERRLGAGPGKPLLIVHGDTMTTLLGTLMGRRLRIPVAHVEAGMRSGEWRTPFPEEVVRRAVSKLVAVHFAPGPRAVANLRRERVGGNVVDTVDNTIRDSIELTSVDVPPGFDLPAEPFGLVSLHRFELLERPERLREVLTIVREASRRRPILFVDHPVTASAVSRARCDHLFGDGFRRIPRQKYSTFIAILKRSEFLVTDSGGSQEECAFLGIPCLIHRRVTEHDTGLGQSVVLSGLDLAVVRRFLDDPSRWRVPPRPLERSPTDTIVAYLEAQEHLLPRARQA